MNTPKATREEVKHRDTCHHKDDIHLGGVLGKTRLYQCRCICTCPTITKEDEEWTMCEFHGKQKGATCLQCDYMKYPPLAPKANEAGEWEEEAKKFYYSFFRLAFPQPVNLTATQEMELLTYLSFIREMRHQASSQVRQSSFNDGLQRAVECLPKEEPRLEFSSEDFYKEPYGREYSEARKLENYLREGRNSALSDARNNITKEIK